MAKKKVSRIPEWQAESDFNTLTQAEEIRANKARTQRAVAAGKKLVKNQEKAIAASRKVIKGKK